MIYLDHAASAPLCEDAKEAILHAFEMCGNPSSAHGAGSASRSLLETSRKTVADCLGCEPDEIVFTSGGTESNALALHGRSRIAVSAVEHVSVLQNAPGAAVIPVRRDGSVDTNAAEPIIQDAGFVSVQYANNELGTIMPVHELGILCKNAGAVFHTDAVQAVGHLPIRLHGEPIDLLSFSAHKFGGPTGIGALYCRHGTTLFPLARGGMQERGRRAGTESVPLICGMAAALQASVRGMAYETERLQKLKDRLTVRLRTLGGKPFACGQALASHVHVRFDGFDASALVHALDLYGIFVSAGAACRADSLEPSHVLLAVGLTAREAKSCLRISMGKTTAERDIDSFCDALAHITNNKTFL